MAPPSGVQTPESSPIDSEMAAGLVLAHTDDILICYSADSTILWASPSLERILGFDPSAVIGTQFRLSVPQDQDGNMAVFNDQIARGADSIRHHSRMQRADGTFLWTEARISVVRDTDGEVQYLVVILQDIDEQVRTEQQLRQSESDFRLMAEHTQDIVFRTDAQHVLQWVSPSFTAILGWDQDHWIGQVADLLIHPDDVDTLAKAERDVRALGATTSDVRVQCSNGSYRWMTLSVQEVASGDRLLRVGSARISEGEHHARTLLSRSEDRLRATMDTLLDPHVVLQAVRDGTGQIVDFLYTEANEAACEYNGMSYQQLVGTRLLDLLPGQADAGIFEAYRRVVETGEPLILDDYAFEQDLGTHRGLVRLYDLRVAKLGDGLSYTWRDVTDRYEAQRTLVASEEKFRLAMSVAPIGMAVLDLSEGFTEVNAALCRLLGRDANWLVGHRMENVLVPGEVSRFHEVRQMLITGREKSHTLEQRFMTATGAIVRLDHSIALARDPDNRPTSFVCQFIDRTRWIQGEEPAEEASKAGRRQADGASVLVASGRAGRFPALATSALLQRRPELIVLEPALLDDLEVRIKEDHPQVVVTMLPPGLPGTDELRRLEALFASAPAETGVVVVTATRQREAKQLLAQWQRPSALLCASTVADDTHLLRAIEAVAQGLVAVDIQGSAEQSNQDPAIDRLDDLTERELDVLDRLSRGMDNAAIAESLCVSVKAVENYVGAVFRKLGLNDETGTHKRLRAALVYLRSQ